MRSVLSFVVVVSALAGGCTSGHDARATSDRPQIVVTTSILGDIVRHAVGDEADVDVIMPSGADPHEFAASTRQAEAMTQADLLVVNGAGLEQGLSRLIDAARDDGTPVFVVADHVALRPLDGEVHAPGDDEHEREGDDDPHIWTDPSMVEAAVRELAVELPELVDLADPDAIAERAAAYAQDLDGLDSDITARLAAIPGDRRVLVTNHESLGYFARRYQFKIVGAVIPSLTTSAGASAGDLEELARVIRDEDVPAIFGETTQPNKLADALAAEVGGDVHVVELYTESLGEPGSGADTYVGMMRTDAERIVAALVQQ